MSKKIQPEDNFNDNASEYMSDLARILSDYQAENEDFQTDESVSRVAKVKTAIVKEFYKTKSVGWPFGEDAPLEVKAILTENKAVPDVLKGYIEALQDIIGTGYIGAIQESLDTNNQEGFYLLVQSAASNKLQKKLTERITDPAQLDLLGNAHILAADFRLHIHLYDELTHGVKQSAARLLDSLMIKATSDGLNNTLVKLPLKEYMTMRGISDEKEIRAQVKDDMRTLALTSFDYKKTTGKERGKWELTIYIGGGTYGQIKNGDIVFRFNQDFYDSFKASDTGKYMYMYFPREALRANIKQRPYTYWLARKIAEHKRINLGKPNADIIGVKTLIDACPNFPTYDAVMRGDRHVTERIIEPFERDMDEINESLSWQYTDVQPTNYQTFIESNVLITWKYYPDTKTIETGRTAYEKKQLPAPRKKKDPRPDVKKQKKGG